MPGKPWPWPTQIHFWPTQTSRVIPMIPTYTTSVGLPKICLAFDWPTQMRIPRTAPDGGFCIAACTLYSTTMNFGWLSSCNVAEEAQSAGSHHVGHWLAITGRNCTGPPCSVGRHHRHLPDLRIYHMLCVRNADDLP